jgi:anti-anti-sigma regulatory factor
MKIEKASQRGKTTLRLSGHLQAEHIGELQKQLQDNGPRFVFDLKEVTVVDVEVVRFLGACEDSGVRIAHPPQYIKEWMNRERER